MCGIIHVQRNDGRPAGKNVFKRYLKQHHRGKDGFGFIAIDADRKVRAERFTEEKDVKNALLAETASNIIFHHRYPTSTENIKELNHPIFVRHKELKFDYYVVHNGVITNDSKLFTDHKELGYIYNTLCEIQKVYKIGNKVYEEDVDTKFNDSESLAIELARYFEGLSEKIGTYGNVAFIAVKVNKKTGKAEQILTGRNRGNPLTIEDNGSLICVRSEGGQILVKEDVITTQDLKTGEVKTTEIDIGWVFKPVTTTVHSHVGYKYTEPKASNWNPEKGTTSQSSLGLGDGVTSKDIESIYDDDDHDFKMDENFILYQSQDIEKKINDIDFEIEELEESIIEYPAYKVSFDESIRRLENQRDEYEAQLEVLWDEAIAPNMAS